MAVHEEKKGSSHNVPKKKVHAGRRKGVSTGTKKGK